MRMYKLVDSVLPPYLGLSSNLTYSQEAFFRAFPIYVALLPFDQLTVEYGHRVITVTCLEIDR